MDNHILLKDSSAKKADTSFTGTVKTYLGKKHLSVVVVRGELLVSIPENEITPRIDRQTPHNYRLKQDPTVTLFCKEDDIAPLGKRDFLLLEGIKSHMARFDVFSNQLDWGLKLKPGDVVYVSLPSRYPVPVQYAAAVIRFVGHLKTEPGIQFGVEITERQFRGYGSTNGFFQGEQLFLCGKCCGLFVGLDKLSPDRQSCSHIKVASSQSESSVKKLPTTNQQHQNEMVTRLKQKTSNSLQRQASGTSDNTPNSTFSIGDRVVVYNKYKARVPGVVRWVGKATDQGVDRTAVGIETDHPVKKEDFADALSRMSSNFKTQYSHHGKVFLPEAFVVSEEVDGQAKGKKDVDEQKHQDEQEFDQVLKAVTEQIDVDEQIRKLEEIEQERRKLNKPQQNTQQNAPPSVNDLIPTSTSCPGTQSPLRGPGLPHSSLSAPPQPNPQPISSQQLDPPHLDNFSAGPSGAQVPVAYAPLPQQGILHGVLDVGSAVQVSDPPRYGVVRWIGELPNIRGNVAGVELDEYMDGCTDGTWRERRYFTCPYGRAFFCPYYNLLPDHRFEEERTQLKKETYEIKKLLQEKCAKFETQLSQAQHEKQALQERYTHLEEQLQQQKQQHTRLEQQLRQERQEAAQERQQTAQLRQEMAQERQEAAEVKQQLERQLQELIADNQRLQQQVADSQAEAQQTQLIQPQRTLEAIEYWKVPRRDIQIIREVGVGAWGSVSEGKYKDQLVAVKQPHRAILTTPIVKRLQREVQIMAQVRHPNLVRFIAAVFDDKVQRLEEPPMIILELLDTNLRTAYERDVLGASKIPIFRDVAYALHYLHEHQDPIIHRDISTPNVLLEALPQGAWKAKVSDFGSANLEKRSKTAGEGAIIYSAPETFPHTDPTTLPPPQTTKIDVFSYGILLCEVITKQLPEDPTIYGQMLQQVKSQWLFMYDLIVSCTKRDPNERPTMAQVLDKLNKLPRPRPRVRQHS